MADLDIHTTPPAASEVAEAIEALEFTRWQPTGDLAAWSKTDDGRNHARVMHAIGLLRGIVAAPGERGEAVEALLSALDEASTLKGDRAAMTNYVELCRRAATALRRTRVDLAQCQRIASDRRAEAESDRDAIRAELTEATAVADIFRAMAEKCPACGKLHAADTLIWAQKPHSIHQCVKDVFGDGCGATWLDRNAKHAMRKIAKALSADLLDGETPEQFGERMREVLDLHVGEHALADERATEATARAERLAADVTRATESLATTSRNYGALEGELKREKEALEAAARRFADEQRKASALRSNLTAERAAHEETRRQLAQATDELTNVATTLGLPEEAPAAAMCEAIGGMQQRLATLEAAPDLGALREELGRVAYGAEHPRGRWECLLDETRERYMAAAEAVARRVVQRVRAAVRSEADACDVSDWQGSYGGAIMHAFDDAVAALSVAIGDLGAGHAVPVATHGVPSGLAIEQFEEKHAAKLADACPLNDAELAHWRAQEGFPQRQTIAWLVAEVSRLRGRR